ncbi:MAG: hypothetical protein M0R50_08520 [Candidatus Cloacimonetes bacterium]|jgi:Tfp pilus assembly protein PilN|nr:hypothetical protein [Candidatus Cloacimonadota bacterium]
MKKLPKEAFGIFQDGTILRIVHLRKEGDKIYLIKMDSTELDSDWYKGEQAKAGSADAEFIPLDVNFMETENYEVNELDEKESTEMADLPQLGRMEVSPSTLLLSRFPLNEGVIALNIHDQHILKDVPGKVKRADLRRFKKESLSPEQRKAGAWHSCVVEAEEGPQHWLYSGPNLLLDAIISYGQESSTKLYFQLADANDVVLTEYYRHSLGDSPEGINLFVYLGADYRKLFIFQDGKWIQTQSVHITQEYPDPEIIYSKLSLALDSAQIREPETIVLAGDLASAQLVEYMNSQSTSTKTTLLHFPNLVIPTAEDIEYSEQVLEPYSLALALAYKALNTDDPDFSRCTFLPNKITDNQKELRVVWHGFIVLSMIFALGLFTTINFMRIKQADREETSKGQNLTFALNKLRAENAVLENLTAEIEEYRKTTQAVSELLKGKNRWTELFHVINSTFSSHRDSWINNLKQNGEKMSISGTTSQRENVSRLAGGLPNGKINSVARSQIRNHSVWNFEIEFTLPEVDWDDIISSEFTDQESEVTTTSNTGTVVRYKPVSSRSTSTNGKNKVKVYRYGILPNIEHEYTPGPIGDELAGDEEMKAMYMRFVESIGKGNMLEYRLSAHVFLQKYPHSQLASLIRWWVAYRLYLDREMVAARNSLRPNLVKTDYYLPYSKLLDARISFALAESSFRQKYEELSSQYSSTLAGKQAVIDMYNIEAGNAR